VGQSHLDLETLTIDREVMRIRDTLSIKYAELVYNGYWCARRASELGHCAAARCGPLAKPRADRGAAHSRVRAEASRCARARFHIVARSSAVIRARSCVNKLWRC
jgi:hypothetical protein